MRSPLPHSRGNRRTSIALGGSSVQLMRKGTGCPPSLRPRPFSFAGVGTRRQFDRTNIANAVPAASPIFTQSSPPSSSRFVIPSVLSSVLSQGQLSTGGNDEPSFAG